MNLNQLATTSMDCVISKCKNKNLPKSNKKFFKVSSTSRKKWALHTDLRNTHHVCEDHFNREDFCGSRLKEEAVPRQFKGKDSNQEKMKEVQIQINGKKHVLKGTILPSTSNVVSKLDLSKIVIKKSVGLKPASSEETATSASFFSSKNASMGFKITQPIGSGNISRENKLQMSKMTPENSTNLLSSSPKNLEAGINPLPCSEHHEDLRKAVENQVIGMETDINQEDIEEEPIEYYPIEEIDLTPMVTKTYEESFQEPTRYEGSDQVSTKENLCSPRTSKTPIQVISNELLHSKEIPKSDLNVRKRMRLNKCDDKTKISYSDKNQKIPKVDPPSRSRPKIVDFVEDETGVKSKVVRYNNKKYVIKIGVLNKEGKKDIVKELENEKKNERSTRKSSAHVLSPFEISKIIKEYNHKSERKKFKEISSKKDENNPKVDETNIIKHDNKKYVIKMGVLNKDSSLKHKKIAKVIQCSETIKKIMLRNKNDPIVDVFSDTKHKIANIRCLLGQLKTIALHNPTDKACNLSNTNFISKVSDGLSTQLYLKCKGCKKVFKIFLTDKFSQSRLNIAAVSASVKTGIGYEGLKALCDGIGVKSLFQNTFDCYSGMISSMNDNNESYSNPELEEVIIKQENVDGNETDQSESESQTNDKYNVTSNDFCETTLNCSSDSYESLEYLEDAIVKEEDIEIIKEEI